jgi:alkylation response protein AidB-like acyl-CoA dehydrogenase
MSISANISDKFGLLIVILVIHPEVDELNDHLMFPYPASTIDESDLILARTLEQWAEKEVLSKRLEHREDYELLLKPAMRKLFVDLEMQKMAWPENCGGIGLNKPDVAQTLAVALEKIGYADSGIGYLFAVTFALCSSFNLAHNHNEELCQRLAPLFCQTETAAIGSLILPAYGTKVSTPAEPLYKGKPLPAKASRNGGSWVISGEKMRPLNSGCDALLFGVLCSLENEKEPGLILVPADSPGLTRGEPILKTGLAASINTDINLKAVRVPVENLVFHDQNSLRQMLAWLYLGVAAVSVGSLFAVFEIIKEWGNTRVIKGKNSPFKENPLTASLMAETGHELLINRLLLYQMAALISRPNDYGHGAEEQLFISALSIVSQITMSAEKAINQTMELMGSAGYATEWNLERYWRDLKTMQIHLGSWELNKIDLARYFFQSKSL